MLDEKEAAAFLLERTEAKRRRTLADPQEAVALAREMGGLALALEQAGAYVAKNGLCFSEYQQRRESRKDEVLAGMTNADELLEQRGRYVANHDCRIVSVGAQVAEHSSMACA
jgi:hypothetical protein